MGERWTLSVCLLVPLVLMPAMARGQDENPPSLEFVPSTDFVPQFRERERKQPKTLFTTSIGSYGLTLGNFDAPVDVALDGEGNYYVLDRGNSRVQKFSDRDRVLIEWGSPGASEGKFLNPSALAVDSENFVYVVDTGNHRVQKFDGEGNFILSWGSLGSTRGKFNGPTDMAFDDQGNIYVLDSGNERIQKFNAATAYTDEWGGFIGGRLGDFSQLTSIAFDSRRLGLLYLLGAGVEEGTCMVQILNLRGGRGEVESSWVLSYPEEKEEPCSPARIEIDNRDDYVYILDSVNGVLRRFTLDGRYLDSIWEADEPFKSPTGFCVQSNDRQVWVADTGNNIVQRFTLR